MQGSRIATYGLAAYAIIGTITALLFLSIYHPHVFTLSTDQPLERYDSNYQFLPDHYVTKNYSLGLIPIDDIGDNMVFLNYTEQRDGYILKKYITQASFDSENIIFYEVLPSDNRKLYDAVFIIPGSGHQGARDVLGIDSEYSARYYYDEIGLELAKNGYAVYVIELRGWGEREIYIGNGCRDRTHDVVCSERIFSDKLCGLGIDIFELRHNEITQILKWIDEREYVDKIVMSGLSAGAAHTFQQLIQNGDIINGVVLAAGLSFANPEESPYNPNQSFKSCQKISVKSEFDLVPMYYSQGLNDGHIFHWEGITNHTYNKLFNIYEKHNKTDDLVYDLYHGHRYNIPEILEFLDKHVLKGD